MGGEAVGEEDGLEWGRASEVVGVVAARLAVRHGCGGGEVLASEV
jgi:hypothetical protein